MNQYQLKNVLIDSGNQLRKDIIELVKNIYSGSDEEIAQKLLDQYNNDDICLAVVTKGDCLAFLRLTKEQREQDLGENGIKIDSVLINQPKCDDKKMFVLAIGYALKKLLLKGHKGKVRYEIERKEDQKYELIIKKLKKFGFKTEKIYNRQLFLPFPHQAQIEILVLDSPWNIWTDLIFDNYYSF
jgi:hypothetical protein